MRVGWERKLEVGDQMDLLPILGCQLSGSKEMLRPRFKPRSVFSGPVENPGKERGAERAGRQQARGAPYRHRLSGRVQRLRMGPSPFPKPRHP